MDRSPLLLTAFLLAATPGVVRAQSAPGPHGQPAKPPKSEGQTAPPTTQAAAPPSPEPTPQPPPPAPSPAPDAEPEPTSGPESSAEGDTTPDALAAKRAVLKQQAQEHSANTEKAIDDADLPRARTELDQARRAERTLDQLPMPPGEQEPERAVHAGAQTTKGASPTSKAVAAAAVSLDEANGNAGCDAQFNFCLFGGAAAASYSLVLGNGHRKGETGHHIVALVVPELGVRYAASRYVSFDLAFYTAIISPTLQVNSFDRKGTSCSTQGGTFEEDLPCEGNAVIRPYGAGLLGATVGTGNSSLGILTVGITAGFARTTQDATAYGFWGLMITSAGLYKTVPLGTRDRS